jgi:hypothetical protein
VEITEAYFTPAEYTSTECKYVEPYGIDFDLKLGQGEQNFAFVRSAKVRQDGITLTGFESYCTLIQI